MKNQIKQNQHYSYTRQTRTISVTKIAGILLCIAGLGLVAFYLVREYNKQPDAINLPALVDSILHGGSRNDNYYVVGELIDTEERAAYADGDMYLYIPRLSFKGPVWDGVTEDVLIKGVGLLEQATLPATMEVNANTSIMGNRDIHGMEFYAIDTLAEGDSIYLIYKEHLYTYEVEGLTYADAYDWRPLETKEYACVTLMAEHPIGINTDRVYATARLTDITPGTSFPMADEPQADSGAREEGSAPEDGASAEEESPAGEQAAESVSPQAPAESPPAASDAPSAAESPAGQIGEGIGLAKVPYRPL